MHRVIISEIWNDYGGADEGLTQAISFLRKALDDTDKKIIQTIPKKEYLLTVAVPIAVTLDLPVTQVSKIFWKIISMTAAAILLLSLVIWNFTNKQTFDDYREPPGTIVDTTYQYQEMKEQQSR